MANRQMQIIYNEWQIHAVAHPEIRLEGLARVVTLLDVLRKNDHHCSTQSIFYLFIYIIVYMIADFVASSGNVKCFSTLVPNQTQF